MLSEPTLNLLMKSFSGQELAAPVGVKIFENQFEPEVIEILTGMSGVFIMNSSLEPVTPSNFRQVLVLGTDYGLDQLELLSEGVWATILIKDIRLNNNLLRSLISVVQKGICPLLLAIACKPIILTNLMRNLENINVLNSSNSTESPFTEIETEILTRIALGHTSKQIGENLGFQLQTVKNRVAIILSKAGAKSRTHAVVIAQSNGWINGSLSQSA